MEELTPAWRGARVLALDLDHCLARYRIHALQRLIYACLARGLCEREGHPPLTFTRLPAPPAPSGAPPPQDAVAGTDYPGEDGAGLDVSDLQRWAVGWAPAFSHKGIVFDAATGDLLKLSATGGVAAAWHGFTQLSAAEALARHGAVYFGFDFLQRRERHPGLAQLSTYFDCPAVVSLAQCVETLDSSSSSSSSGGSGGGAGASAAPPSAPALLRYQHLLQQHSRTFDHIFDNAAAFGSGRGGFFAALRMHPSLYIAARPRAAAALRALRAARATRVLLVTNSNPEFARFILRASLGADCLQHFDALFYSSAKPAWFQHGEAAPSLAPLAPGAQLPLGADWSAGAEFCGGSAGVAVAAYGREGLVFVGDHVVTDVAAAAQCQAGSWAAVGVVEELEGEAQGVGPWGPFKGSWFGHLLAAHASAVTADATELLERLAAGAAEGQ